jgi:hypothetical protein
VLSAGANFSDGKAVKDYFDEVFCFGAGNQDVARDFKFQAPEFLFTGEMLRGFSGGAACEQGMEALRVAFGDGFFGMRVDPGTFFA